MNATGEATSKFLDAVRVIYAEFQEARVDRVTRGFEGPFLSGTASGCVSFDQPAVNALLRGTAMPMAISGRLTGLVHELAAMVGVANIARVGALSRTAVYLEPAGQSGASTWSRG